MYASSLEVNRANQLSTRKEIEAQDLGAQFMEHRFKSNHLLFFMMQKILMRVTAINQFLTLSTIPVCSNLNARKMAANAKMTLHFTPDIVEFNDSESFELMPQSYRLAAMMFVQCSRRSFHILIRWKQAWRFSSALIIIVIKFQRDDFLFAITVQSTSKT